MTARARCRSCDAEIIWARTTTGAAMPVDADPHPDGNVVFTGRAHTGGAVDRPEVEVLGDPTLFPDDRPRHRSHFATCPDADTWRRR